MQFFYDSKVSLSVFLFFGDVTQVLRCFFVLCVDFIALLGHFFLLLFAKKTKLHKKRKILNCICNRTKQKRMNDKGRDRSEKNDNKKDDDAVT